jgi:2-amino-4-hydroxy-6-hydroxymethyldihydropteridine diphosphokinase
MTRCLIALGGNIGVSEAVFEAAMSQLQRPGIDLIRVAKTLKTRPVGASAGEEFLNTAATLETSLDPQELLSALHEVENAFGRTRTIHWGPRTLDLDLCLFGDEIIDSNLLVIPHPAMWYRRFVIDPALDVAAEMQHPLLRQSIRELHRELHQCPLKIAISDSETNPAMSVCSAVLKEALHLDPAIEWLAPPNSPIVGVTSAGGGVSAWWGNIKTKVEAY